LICVVQDIGGSRRCGRLVCKLICERLHSNSISPLFVGRGFAFCVAQPLSREVFDHFPLGLVLPGIWSRSWRNGCISFPRLMFFLYALPCWSRLIFVVGSFRPRSSRAHHARLSRDSCRLYVLVYLLFFLRYYADSLLLFWKGGGSLGWDVLRRLGFLGVGGVGGERQHRRLGLALPSWLFVSLVEVTKHQGGGKRIHVRY